MSIQQQQQQQYTQRLILTEFTRVYRRWIIHQNQNRMDSPPNRLFTNSLGSETENGKENNINFMYINFDFVFLSFHCCLEINVHIIYWGKYESNRIVILSWMIDRHCDEHIGSHLSLRFTCFVFDVTLLSL